MSDKSTQELHRDEDVTDLGALLAQLVVRKWTIAAFVLFSGLAAAFYVQIQREEFTALSVVQIEQRSTGIALPSEVLGELVASQFDPPTGLETQFHIIRSRLTLEPVVNELGLALRVESVRVPVIGAWMARSHLPVLNDLLPDRFARPGERLGPVSYIGAQPGQANALLLRVLDAGHFEVVLPSGAPPVTGRVGGAVALATGAELRVDAIDAPAGREFAIWRDEMRVASASTAERLSLAERGRSGIVDFRFSGPEPARSVETVNAIVQSYVNQNLRRRSAQIDQSIDFIELQLPQVRESLAEAQARLNDYRQDRGATELSLNVQDVINRAIQIETELDELAFQEEQLAQRLTPAHPEYRQLLAQRERLEGRLEEMRTELGRVPEAEQELAALSEDVERASQLERQLSTRVEQLRILQASTVGNIRMLEPAEHAPRSAPSRQLPLVLGVMLGLLAGVMYVLVANALRRGIDDGQAVEQLGLPLFATVGKVRGLGGIAPTTERYALALADPQDIAVEALRGLRTGLQFSLAAARQRSLMLTSCAPDDGKSFIALNLAIVSAQAATKVLLIDGDMRRGALRKVFGLPRGAEGLSDYLAHKAGRDAIIRHDDRTGVDFIAAGGLPPNPADILSGPALADLLADAAERYDLVIVDAPPVLAVSDPAIIGQHVGMSLLVLRHLNTTRNDIQAAQKLLATSGVRLSGAILNQHDASRSRYGQRGGRYGYYGYQYSYR